MSIRKRSTASSTTIHLTGADANNFIKALMKPDAKPAPPTVQELAELAYNEHYRIREMNPIAWIDLSPLQQHTWILVIQKIIARIEASR